MKRFLIVSILLLSVTRCAYPTLPQETASPYFYAPLARGTAPRNETGKIVTSLPPMMHFCDVNCTTLQWNGAVYVSLKNNNFADPGWSDIWTVEQFSPQSVILHRTETGRYAFSVVYRAQIAPSGDRLINAANPFGSGNGQPAFIQLAWGNALNAVPGSNEDRDNRIAQARSSGANSMSPQDRAKIQQLNQALIMGLVAGALMSDPTGSPNQSEQSTPSGPSGYIRSMVPGSTVSPGENP